MVDKFNITKHNLVPKHSKLNEKEKTKLLETRAIDLRDLPKIVIKDPAISGLEVKEGDVIKIERTSLTAGTSIFYRRVVNA